MFGMSINVLNANIRMEGLEDILKSVIIDKLSLESLISKLKQDPEKLLDILKMVAEKVNR